MKKIGLTQRVQTDGRHGERRDCLDQRWAEFLCACDLYAIPLSNLVENVGGYIRTLELDGVILTGGNDISGYGENDPSSERDAFEHKLIDICTELSIPVLGICRGMQMLNVHHGGKLVDIDGHAGTEHELKILEDGRLGKARSVTVNSYHTFAIEAGGLGTGLRPLATTSESHIEAVDATQQNHLGVMWHPERVSPFSEADIKMVCDFFGSADE